MSSFEHFEDLDEVTDFGEYLVKVEAIPAGGLLYRCTVSPHVDTSPVMKARNLDGSLLRGGTGLDSR